MTTRDMTARRRAAQELEARARQQAAVAELGVLALQSRAVQPILESAVSAVAATIDVDVALLLERVGADLVVRAAHGCPPSFRERRIGLADARAARQTLETGEPVYTDVLEETALCELGITSGLTVPVHGLDPTTPFGVLAAHTRAPRGFSQDDVNFVQAVANVIATALSRHAAEAQLVASELRAAEERQRTSEAEAAVRERDEFMSIVAHELRTPLTALNLKLEGLGALAREPSRLEAALPGRLEGAIRQTQRLMTLVERLLDMSRVAAGRIDLSVEPCDLAALTREVIHDLREHAKDAQATVAVSGESSIEGAWDPARVRQILTNIIGNALKYGEGRPVSIELGAVDGVAHVRVIDQGIGIAPEDQARIFGRFERAAPVSNYGGVGLGLFVSRQLARAHGGDILLSSTPGAGSTFEVRLPRA